MDSFKYHQRGVSSDKKEVHQAISDLDKGLYPNAFCKILPDIFTNNMDLCCIAHSDTVGTKGILSYLTWKETGNLKVWERLAQDAIVMNIDDMLCSGAKGPFLISNTITRNKNLIDGAVIASIIQGNAKFVQMLNDQGVQTLYGGGETADVGDVVRTIDNGITATSVFPKIDVVDISIQPGDFIVGLGSSGKTTYETEYNSGISCNGLTSARHDILSSKYKKMIETFDPSIDDELIYSGSYELTDKVDNKEESIEIWDLLTAPTRTFAPVLKVILEEHRDQIHGIIHNTGGAHTKVLNFVNGLKIIKNNLLDVPLIFDLIQQESMSSYKEMYQVFNMGTRMEIYCPSEDFAESIISISKSYNLDADIIGVVEENDDKGSSSLEIKTPDGIIRYG
jgi:phosphoribosylformylglycinamidine cyclo-ligase